MIERMVVQSSNLASVGYDPDTETLEVEFINCRVYQYLGVPQFIYEELMSSPSLGRYLNHNIIPQYACQLVG